MLAALVSFLLHYLIFALILSIGLAAKPRDLALIVRQPRLYARAVVVMELLVPLLAIAAVIAFDVPPIGTAMIVLMAICPGAPFIPLATKRKGEHHSVVGLNLLVVTALLAPLTIPLWVIAIDGIQGLELAITPAQVLGKVVPTVLLPLALGLLLRSVWPRGADLLARVAHYFFLVAAVVAIGALLYIGLPLLTKVPARTYLAVVVFVLGAVLLGYWAASPQPRARHTVAVATVLGNPGLALAIVAASYPGFRAAAFAAAYLIVRRLMLVPFDVWMRRHPQPPAQAPGLRTERPQPEARRPMGAA